MHCFDVSRSNSTLFSHPKRLFFFFKGERATALKLETLENIDFAMETATPLNLAAPSPYGLARGVLS